MPPLSKPLVLAFAFDLGNVPISGPHEPEHDYGHWTQLMRFHMLMKRT
jgi:hypothetical protein